MARRELSVAPREVLGKKVAQLRRDGFTPANIYGHGIDSLSVQVSADELEKTLRAASANEVLDVKVEGESAARPVIVHHIQRHPLTSGTLHADFYQVSLREKMRADVPLVITGTSNAVETYNGVLVTQVELLHVEALPLDIPTHIEVDISVLKELEAAVHVRDLIVPGNVTVLTDLDVVVAKVESPRVADEAETTGEAAVTDDADAEESPPSGRSEQEPEATPGESGA